MSDSPTLPLEFSVQQLFDMCVRALIDASSARFQALLARGSGSRAIFSGDEKQARQIQELREQIDELEAKAKILDTTAREHAQALVGQTVVLTGTILRDAEEWQSGTPGLIGSGHYVTNTYTLEVEKSKHVITRVEVVREQFMDSHTIRFYFKYYGGSEYYFELPHRSYKGDLKIEFT